MQSRSLGLILTAAKVDACRHRCGPTHAPTGFKIKESRIQTNEADILENKESIGKVEDFQNGIASVSSFNDLVKFIAIVSLSHASFATIGANEIITFLEADKCRTTCEIPAVQNNILSAMDPSTGVFVSTISSV